MAAGRSNYQGQAQLWAQLLLCLLCVCWRNACWWRQEYAFVAVECCGDIKEGHCHQRIWWQMLVCFQLLVRLIDACAKATIVFVYPWLTHNRLCSSVTATSHTVSIRELSVFACHCEWSNKKIVQSQIVGRELICNASSPWWIESYDFFCKLSTGNKQQCGKVKTLFWPQHQSFALFIINNAMNATGDVNTESNFTWLDCTIIEAYTIGRR